MADKDMFAHRIILGAYNKASLDLYIPHGDLKRMVSLEHRDVSSADFKRSLAVCIHWRHQYYRQKYRRNPPFSSPIKNQNFAA